jgi:hypothetical protein
MIGTAREIPLRPAVVASVLGAIAAGLVAASVAGQLSTFLLNHNHVKGLVPLFDLSREQNIPTFFSAVLLLLTVATLGVIAALARHRPSGDAFMWAILAGGFLFLAYDEAFQVHERLIVPFQQLLGDQHRGMLFFAWVVPGMAGVALCAAFFFRFWLRQSPRTRVLFLVAAALYLGGAIGAELASGHHVVQAGSDNLKFNLLSALEESLEMSGIILFIYTLLRHIGDTYGEVRLSVGGGSTAAALSPAGEYRRLPPAPPA